MEKTVRFNKITNTRTGVSQSGNAWESVEFLTDFHNGKTTKFVQFKTMNAGNEVKNLKEGDTIKVNVEVESREWQGKYFTDAVAYKVELVSELLPLKEEKGKITLTEPLGKANESGDLPF